MQDMLMKERLSCNDQFDEQSTLLTKKGRLIEKLRKENEVNATSYVCRQEWTRPDWIKIHFVCA